MQKRSSSAEPLSLSRKQFVNAKSDGLCAVKVHDPMKLDEVVKVFGMSEGGQPLRTSYVLPVLRAIPVNDICLLDSNIAGFGKRYVALL